MDTTQLFTSLASLQLGALHPLLGLDHLLALLGVGMLYRSSTATTHEQSNSSDGKLIPSASLLFVPVMLLAAIFGLGDGGLPAMETGITLSLIVLGAVLMQHAKIPSGIKAPLILGFAAYHGLAHGLEMPHAAQPAYYLLGMVMTSALLQAAGFKLQDILQALKTRRPESKAGAVLALIGVYLTA